MSLLQSGERLRNWKQKLRKEGGCKAGEVHREQAGPETDAAVGELTDR